MVRLHSNAEPHYNITTYYNVLQLFRSLFLISFQPYSGPSSLAAQWNEPIGESDIKETLQISMFVSSYYEFKGVILTVILRRNQWNRSQTLTSRKKIMYRLSKFPSFVQNLLLTSSTVRLCRRINLPPVLFTNCWLILCAFFARPSVLH